MEVLLGSRRRSTAARLVFIRLGIMDNSTLTDNVAAHWGGALRNSIGTAFVHVTGFSGNQAGTGGGVASDGVDSFLSLAHDNFAGNQAQFYGGGVYYQGSILSIIQSVFISNTALFGGGLSIGNSVSPITTVATSTFDGNSANDGGAIDNDGAALILNDTFSNNSAGTGAGLRNTGTADLTNDTFSGNTAAGRGGGLRGSLNSKTTLQNVTLAGNGAVTAGGAVYLDTGAALTATNTILAYSSHSGNCAGAALASSHYSLSDDLTCALAGKVHGIDSNGQDPRLSALGNFGGFTLVYMPKHDSPAIDGVVGSDAPNTDKRGLMRPVNGGHGNGYDIGAVERQPFDTDWPPRLYLPLVRR